MAGAYVSHSAAGMGANDVYAYSGYKDIASGSLVVVAIGTQEGATAPTGVALSSGETLTACGAATNEWLLSQLWYCFTSEARTNVRAVATFAAARRYKFCDLIELTGIDQTGTVHAYSQGANGAKVTGDLVTTVDTCIISVIAGSNDRSFTPDTTNGTPTEIYDFNASNGYGCGQTMHLMNVGAGTYTMSASPSSSTTTTIAAAAFKVSAGATSILRQMMAHHGG